MVSIDQLLNKEASVCVVGLGYVGLPLAVLLDKKFKVTGFDISLPRLEELKAHHDRTREITSAELEACSIRFTADSAAIRECDVVIVTVPTPIDGHNKPDLRPILGASATVGRNLKEGAIVVYESTVYPGVTEEECVPVLERESGLTWKTGFNVGYSPERVNPGDKNHTIDKIMKVVAGDSEPVAALLRGMYGTVITAGIHAAPTIKTAEAAKVIENTQRDLNIALMNELALIFGKMGINTNAVLEAAGTKWNFLKFTPGLVGGHCIGVDPYYLTFKAESIGYHPQVILSGRKINDGMGKHVAEQTVKKMIQAGKAVKGSKVLIMGFTFKEDISDIRNTRIIDIYRELEEYGVELSVHDPLAYPEEVEHEYGLSLTADPEASGPYDAVILAVKHKPFLVGAELARLRKLMGSGKGVLMDIKGIYTKEAAEANDMLYWSL